MNPIEDLNNLRRILKLRGRVQNLEVIIKQYKIGPSQLIYKVSELEAYRFFIDLQSK